ncbi:MFS transporter [Tepidiforma sp.]|uniref:MFS transporter n=1 Tax=Tepidiforma sp. TaxID=2682230 RepID=UPI0021DB8B95|nr:MFS transporter [Tepidiforma sp.]MCX7618810.1 MFS transporter [Tepidiforma sp.]GIW16971.1 MAG: MFS transporter [Tepidiforma sp.]
MEYRWRALAAVAFGTYMATMDFSIVNVALPTLAREFDRSPDAVVWATLISSLAVTGLTLTAGRAGDLYGRKRVYLAGWAIFTAGMLLASFAATLEQLVAMRLLQSVGVALAIANGNAIVTEAFPPAQRGQALGTTGAVVGAGLMSGPILGGLILQFFSWHAIFLLRVPIGLAALLLAWAVIRPSQPAGGPGSRRMDVPGAFALFATLSAALLAVNRGQAWGWTSPAILALFALAAASLAAFIRIESRSPSPVVALGLFRERAYSVGVSSLALNFAGQSAVTFLLPFYLQEVKGYSTGQVGLVVATVPLMMLLLSPLSGRASDRYGFAHQATVGIALVAIGLLSLATITADTPLPAIIARLAVVGIGTSMFMSPNSATIMNSVPPDRLGTASASVATARNIGNAVGLALASAVLVAVATASAGFAASRVADLPDAAIVDGVRAAFAAAGVASSFAVVASLFRGQRRVTVIAAEQAPVPGGGNTPAH